MVKESKPTEITFSPNTHTHTPQLKPPFVVLAKLFLKLIIYTPYHFGCCDIGKRSRLTADSSDTGETLLLLSSITCLSSRNGNKKFQIAIHSGSSEEKIFSPP